MKKYNLNRYTLRYQNSSYEKEFNEKDTIKKYKLQAVITAYYTLMNAIYQGVEGFDLNLTLYTSMLWILLFVVYHKKIFVYYTNILISLATQFSYLIYIKQREGTISAGEIYLNGQAVACLFLLSSQSFYFDAITMILCQAILRYMMQTLNYLNLLDAFQIIFINTTFKYLQQKQERQTFFEKKRAEQWNLCTDNLFQNTVVLTKYDKVTCKVCVEGIKYASFIKIKYLDLKQVNGKTIRNKQTSEWFLFAFYEIIFDYSIFKKISLKAPIDDCNYQARKLKINDDDSFEEFSQMVKIDLSKSKINFLMQNEKNTLKDYLLLRHYFQANQKNSKKKILTNQISTQAGSSQQDTNQQEIKKTTQQITDGSTSIKFTKHDVLYVTYEDPKYKGDVKRMKIKAGKLELDFPFIILSMQDVSSQTNLSNLKIKSTKNDLIYIKSINEIRDKVVKIINQITSSKFLSAKSETNNTITLFNQRGDDGQNNGYITYKKQKSFQDQKDNTNTNKQQYLLPNNFLNGQDQITFKPASENQILDDEKDKIANIEKNDLNQSPKEGDINQNQNNVKKEIKQLYLKQDEQQIKNQSLNNIFQSKNNSIQNFSKNNLLQLPLSSDPLISQFGQRIAESQTQRIADFIRDRDEQSDIASEMKSQKSSKPYQQNNNQNYRMLKKSSFNQSYLECDSLQFIENEDNVDYKMATLKLTLSCLLNNTYSLLDFIILSNEKQHFKKLIVKPNQMSLKKVEIYLKQLFPNLKVTYSSLDLQEKEIKTDIRRLKYILISIISSYFFRKKEQETQMCTSPNRLTNNTLMIITDQQMNQPTAQNKNKQQQKNQNQIQNLEFDRQIEILLSISISEQTHFTSINFSIMNSGSMNLQQDNSQNMINSFKLKNKSDSCIPNSYRNKLNEPEKFFSFVTTNMCMNGTCDSTIRQMEIRNIYFNIMRLGPFIPEYDSALNLFSFDIFENIDIIQQLPSPTQIQNTQTNINIQPSQGFNIDNNGVKQVSGQQQPIKINLNLSPSYQQDNQSFKHRKSNFFQQGSPNQNNTLPNFKSSENVRKKSAQRSKFNSNESVFSKKKIQLDEFKQQAIERIKENIQSFEDDCHIASYITFTSGNEQKMEEHMDDSLYVSKKIPKSFWDIVQSSEEIQNNL